MTMQIENHFAMFYIDDIKWTAVLFFFSGCVKDVQRFASGAPRSSSGESAQSVQLCGWTDTKICLSCKSVVLSVSAVSQLS